jgi:hypothetical protein
MSLFVNLLAGWQVCRCDNGAIENKKNLHVEEYDAGESFKKGFEL